MYEESKRERRDIIHMHMGKHTCMYVSHKPHNTQVVSSIYGGKEGEDFWNWRQQAAAKSEAAGKDPRSVNSGELT
jgi:hypothetical protein